MRSSWVVSELEGPFPVGFALIGRRRRRLRRSWSAQRIACSLLGAGSRATLGLPASHDGCSACFARRSALVTDSDPGAGRVPRVRHVPRATYGSRSGSDGGGRWVLRTSIEASPVGSWANSIELLARFGERAEINRPFSIPEACRQDLIFGEKGDVSDHIELAELDDQQTPNDQSLPLAIRRMNDKKVEV